MMTPRARRAARALLRRTGLLTPCAAAKRHLALWVDPAARSRERERRAEFAAIRRAYGRPLGCRLGGDRPDGSALLVSIGFIDGVKWELPLLKGLELGGLEPVVLTWRDPWLVRFYRLAGVRRVVFWDEFVDEAAREADLRRAEAWLGAIRHIHELLKVTDGDVRVGKLATSTAFRRLRVGSLDVSSPQARSALAPFLADALAYARAAERIAREMRPRVALFADKGYTPHGELFEWCVAHGIDAATWGVAPQSHGVILKRYAPEHLDEDPASLSPATWQLVQAMGWTGAERKRLFEDLRESYATGDWFSEVGTQFHTRVFDAGEVRRRLGLDATKKTAVIFPHILWDGTFFEGTDLFANYEEWLIETVRAACANPRVNWVLKFHPANLVKNARDGVGGEPAEVTALARAIGSLPSHVRVMHPQSEVSTFSLFDVMDSCVTVRGTIGMEAAAFGIPVLTAGTGRYDRRGFTIDSDTQAAYLDRLRHIQDIPRLTPMQQERAQRFAYGVFVLRPLVWTTIRLGYRRDQTASCTLDVGPATKADWLTAPDLAAFAEWALHSHQPDFLVTEPRASGAGAVPERARVGELQGSRHA